MHVRWESASRYYEAVLQQDLLGDWVLSTARGEPAQPPGRHQASGLAFKGSGGQRSDEPAQAAPAAGLPVGVKERRT